MAIHVRHAITATSRNTRPGSCADRRPRVPVNPTLSANSTSARYRRFEVNGHRRTTLRQSQTKCVSDAAITTSHDGDSMRA